MNKIIRAFFCSTVFLFLIPVISFAQDSIFTPDLSKVVIEDGWKVFNRKVSLVKDNKIVSVYLNSQEGDGIAWLEGFEFKNGIIEVDIKGKDVQGTSRRRGFWLEDGGGAGRVLGG